MLLRDDYIIIKLGKLVFTSMKMAKPYFTLDPDAIVGWFDGVSTKRDKTPKSLAWGDFAEKGYGNARIISISGLAVANTPQQLQAMRDEFMGTLNHGGYEEISVRTISSERFAKVALEGKPDWVPQLDTVAAWKLELYAADPHIYGPVFNTVISNRSLTGGLKYPVTYPMEYSKATTLDSTVITNNGNAEAWPIFTVVGDFFSGFRLGDGKGSNVVFSGIVTSTAPMVVNMSDGTAVQNGQDRSVFFTKRDFFSVKPKETITPEFEPLASGSGWCDIIYRDTWI